MSVAIGLVTARAARGLDDDEAPLVAALEESGAEVRVLEWDDPSVDWAAFDLALLRSTWDYTERLQSFLAWVERAAQATTLLNPPSILRWNTDKHYLADLSRAGVPTVPSTFVEVREEPGPVLERFLGQHACEELVVKPAVGAGSRDTQRYPRAALGPALAHAQRLLDGKRSVLLQPYLGRVDRDGETALIYFAGRFSHAIRKGPLLPPAGAATEGLFAPEQITPRVPGQDELAVAQQVLAALPFETPLYARVDLIREADGSPCLLELELTEPSLFFAHAPGSARRFATTVLDWRRLSQVSHSRAH
jgi:O-ureido-D-serine cyclo-ligase